MTYWKLENGIPVTATIKPSIYDIDYVASRRIAFDRVGPWTVATTLCAESLDQNPRFKTIAHQAGDNEGWHEAYAATVAGAIECHAYALAYIASDPDPIPDVPS
jgi:hypothetical protein